MLKWYWRGLKFFLCWNISVAESLEGLESIRGGTARSQTNLSDAKPLKSLDSGLGSD